MKRLCLGVFPMLAMLLVTTVSVAADRTIQVSEEEYQAIQRMRAEKKSGTKKSGAASNLLPSRTTLIARPPEKLEDLQAKTADKSFQERFVFVYRALSDEFNFKGDPAELQGLGGKIYEDENRFWSGLQGAIRLREDLDGIKSAHPVVDDRGEISFNAAENPQAQKEDKAASFGWSRDGVADSETWKGKGALYMPVAFLGNDDNPLGSGFHVLGYRNNWNVFYPAVRFERDSSKDGTDAEINTLDFLVGVDMNFIPDDTPIDQWLQDSLGNLAGVVRVAAGVRTNFDFEDTTFLTEFSYMPVDKENAVNAYLTEGDLPALLHKIILKGFGAATESRFVSLAPTKGDAGGDLEDVLPLGFEAGLAIKPGDIAPEGMWSNLELSATYRGQWDLLNSGEFHGLLEVSLSLPFIEDETTLAGWKVSYKRGDDLTNYDELDELSIGLQVKF